MLLFVVCRIKWLAVHCQRNILHSTWILDTGTCIAIPNGTMHGTRENDGERDRGRERLREKEIITNKNLTQMKALWENRCTMVRLDFCFCLCH